MLFVVFGALLSILNPLGTVPIFVGLTQEHSVRERANIAMRTALNVLGILLVAFFLGKYVLSFFGIGIQSLKIAGGLIIASSGFSLLTGTFAKHKGMKKKQVKEDVQSRDDISLTPLAIPMIAGPGAISLLITYNQKYTEYDDLCMVLAAIFLVSFVIFMVLRSAHFIVARLGASGINGLSRIIGFVVIAIGVEFVTSACLELVFSRLVPANAS